MSEGQETPKPISRRTFLKFLGIGASAAALSACTPESSKKPELSFKEVEKFDKVPLYVNREAKEVTINYANEFIDKLQIRKRDEGSIIKEFTPDAETVRILGEITDSKLYKAGRNPNLNDGINVGIYSTANGPLNDKIHSRENLVDSERLYALKVIVNGAAAERYELGVPEFEKNKNYSKNNSLSMPEFAQGVMVGYLEGSVFNALGYVCDERAVTLK